MQGRRVVLIGQAYREKTGGRCWRAGPIRLSPVQPLCTCSIVHDHSLPAENLVREGAERVTGGSASSRGRTKAGDQHPFLLARSQHATFGENIFDASITVHRKKAQRLTVGRVAFQGEYRQAMAGAFSVRESGDSVKLFVGQVPKQLSEQQIAAIFGEAGSVREINIIKDKLTKQSRGCCFVTFSSREEADNAIALFHDKKTLPPVNSPLQVKYADGELERLEHKLFIGMLPNTVSEADVKDLFSKFGNIKELSVIKGSQPTSKGCAFLKYESKEQAVAAIDALNGAQKLEGSTSALVVKWADTEKERQARKAQKAQASVTTRLTGQQQPSLFGAMPIGYSQTPQPINGYTYQATSTYGMLPYSTPGLQTQQAMASGIMSPLNMPMSVPEQTSDLVTQMGNPSYAPVQYAGYVDPVYQSFSGIQYPMAYPGALLYPGVNSNSVPLIGMSPSPAGQSPSVNSAGITPQTEGPPGANLFIYHIPLEFGDQELSTTFSSFGNVISAKVFVDRATGASKCFGFVSYDTPEAAQAAINVMNGFQLSGKRLKVQLKRDTKQGKPY